MQLPLGYSWNVETAGLCIIQATRAGSGNRLWSTDLYRAYSLGFQETAGCRLCFGCTVWAEYSVCLEAQIRLGKKEMQECRKSLFSAFFFFLSSISSVCMRENKGMRVASEQHYAHCVPWSVEYPWTPRWSEVSNWCWTLWWIQVIESRSGWKHLNLGYFNPELKLHSKDRNEVTVPCCNSVFCVSK